MADPRVTETIRAVARRRRVPFKHLKAAIETGIVESGLTNPKGGTGDSAGWRQERRSLYRDPTSVKHAAERFFDETATMDRPGMSSGELAARVQRPRAQYRGRYAQVASQAEQVLHGLSGVPYSAAAASTGSRVVNTLRESSKLDQGAFDDARKLAVVGRLLAKRRGTGGALFQSGVLSTTDPNPADFMRSTLTGGVSTRKGAAGGSAAAALPRGRSGIGHFDGKPVAAWMVPLLQDARRKGWKGTVQSGVRTDAEQTRIYRSGVRPAALPKSMGGHGSKHEETGFLHGAIDVTDPEGLDRVLRRKHSRLKYAGRKDPVHFSVPSGGSY